MDHQKYREWILLNLYGELSKEEEIELQKHLSFCRQCNAEYESQKKFNSFITAKIPLEVNQSLLDEARFQLKHALRNEKRKVPVSKKVFGMIEDFFTGNYKVGLAGIALLIAGGIIGYFISKPEAENIVTYKTQNEFSFLSSDVQISNVRFIDQDPSDGEIEFEFNAIKPVKIKGDINDERIKNILMYSMLNEKNPGTRLNSVNMIGSNVVDEKENEIKEAAISVIKYDENSGVRREGLKLLKKFPYDEEIKETLLFVLMNDKNSALRIEAINNLIKLQEEGLKFNEKEVVIFQEKMKEDENSYVRFQAKNVIEEIKQQ
jgi:hypothetical protein